MVPSIKGTTSLVRCIGKLVNVIEILFVVLNTIPPISIITKLPYILKRKYSYILSIEELV